MVNELLAVCSQLHTPRISLLQLELPHLRTGIALTLQYLLRWLFPRQYDLFTVLLRVRHLLGLVVDLPLVLDGILASRVDVLRSLVPFVCSGGSEPVHRLRVEPFPERNCLFSVFW